VKISQEILNRIKQLIRKDGRCVVESVDEEIRVRAYPKKVRL